MQLISTLAAGIVGAENGYAKVLVRGSTKRARYFADFEGQEAIEGSDVQLDQNGGAVVYTNLTVEVLVYNEHDQLVRRWVEASTSACVEVISRSFTGADYETGEGGPNRPTTAAAVWDRLYDSFGAEDFLVKMPDGSNRTMQAAVGSITSLYRSVKSPLYGATGNGVTNDRPAIQAAIDAAHAAGGGTVFFPAGTYLLDGTSLLVSRIVTLTGSGAACTMLVSPSTANPVIEFHNLDGGTPVGGVSSLVQNLGFSHNVAAGRTTANLISTRQVTFRNCSFAVRAASAVTMNAQCRAIFDDCDFTIGGAGAAIDSTGTNPRDYSRIDVRRCRFTMLSTGTAPIILKGANLHLYGCVYDGTAATVSNVVVVAPEGTSPVTCGSVRCCEFLDSATRPITCMSVGVMSTANEFFAEDGNFLSALHASSKLYGGTFGTTVGPYCRLGTRESRVLSIVTGTTPIAITTLEHGVVNIRFTAASNFSIQPDAVCPFGARLRILVVNGDVAARTVTFASTARGGSFVVGAGKMIGFELVRAVANNGISDVASWYLVGTSGILTTGTDSGYAV